MPFQLIAENGEAIARDGRMRALYQLTGSWREARRLSGPVPRINSDVLPPHPSFDVLKREWHWGPWEGVRALRAVVDPGMGHEPPSLDWLSWCAEAEPSALELLAVNDHRVRAASKIEALDRLTGSPASTPRGSESEWWVVEARVNHNGMRSDVAIDPERFKREAATIRRTGGAQERRARPWP